MSAQLQKMLTKRQKYARTGYIRRSYRAKHIINRFPNMKSIMYTNKRNKAQTISLQLLKMLSKRQKYARTDYIHRS